MTQLGARTLIAILAVRSGSSGKRCLMDRPGAKTRWEKGTVEEIELGSVNKWGKVVLEANREAKNLL